MTKETPKKTPKKSKVADPVIETVVETPVADKCTIYIWCDLRIEGCYQWRYVAVFNDKHYIGRQTQHNARDCLLSGVYQLTILSNFKIKESDLMLGNGKGHNPERVQVITDALPPKAIWAEAEKHYETSLAKKRLDPKAIVAAIDDIIKQASNFSERAASMGGFADAAAVDELISRAELGKLAIQRLGGVRNGFGPRMMMGMMGGPGGMMWREG